MLLVFLLNGAQAVMIPENVCPDATEFSGDVGDWMGRLEECEDWGSSPQYDANCLGSISAHIAVACDFFDPQACDALCDAWDLAQECWMAEDVTGEPAPYDLTVWWDGNLLERLEECEEPQGNWPWGDGSVRTL